MPFSRRLTWVLCTYLFHVSSSQAIAIQKLSAHLMNLSYGVFCEFSGEFWYVREEIVILEGFVKVREIRNIEDLL